MAESTKRTLTDIKNGIILCDVDDTIVGPDFELTTPLEDLKAAVAHAQASGYLVGLASDRPAKMLAKNAFDWGMEGPIIAENGAGLMLTAADEIRGVQEWNRSFPQLRKLFSEAVQLLDEENLGYRLVSGNSRHIVRNLKSADWIDEAITTLAIINSEREYSMSFFVRSRFTARGYKEEWGVHSGELRYLAKLAERVLAFSSHRERFRTTLIDDIGICVIADRDSTKQRGLHLLREYIGYEMPVHMIGNSIHDFLGEGNVEHYAVGNASDAFRDRCTYFTGTASTYTTATIQILRYIVDPIAAYRRP